MSGCGCSIDFDNDNGPEFLHDSYPTARKQHKCCECGKTIAPGEKYLRETGKWDDIKTFKTCTDCESIRDAYFCGHAYRHVLEDLYYDIRESFGEYADSRLAGLTPRAREMVIAMIEKVWAELDRKEAA